MLLLEIVVRRQGLEIGETVRCTIEIQCRQVGFIEFIEFIELIE
jgi:hypothetical protein